MLVAGIFFSLMNLGVKYLGHIPAIEIVFFRCLVSIVLSFIMIRRAKISFLGNNKKVLFLRAIFGVTALCMYFATLQKLPFATAVTLQQLSPIFTTIFAIFLLKEKIQHKQWLFFILSFTGVALIKGFDKNVSELYLIIALGASLFSALAYNMIRKLKDTDHPLVVVFYFPLIAMPITGLIAYFNWVMPMGWDWIILLGIGVVTQVAQVNMTKALQLEEVGTVSIVRYLTVIYAIFFGYTLFGEVYNFMTLLGIILVVGGVILNLLFKNKRKTISLNKSK